MIYEGHGRISQALLAVAAALVGFAAMLVGNFSRFGRWRQILGAVIAGLFGRWLWWSDDSSVSAPDGLAPTAPAE